MDIQIRIRQVGIGAPAGKLENAEAHFSDGVLAGLRLVGFAVWARRDGKGNTVSFPARPFVVHGERQNFALLRAAHQLAAQQPLRDLMLEAYMRRRRPPPTRWVSNSSGILRPWEWCSASNRPREVTSTSGQPKSGWLGFSA
jgi:hypothetical protein